MAVLAHHGHVAVDCLGADATDPDMADIREVSGLALGTAYVHGPCPTHPHTACPPPP